MEEADFGFRITLCDGEVPLPQHLLYSASSVGLSSHHSVLPRRPESTHLLPTTHSPEHTQPIPAELKIYLARAYILDDTVHVLG